MCLSEVYLLRKNREKELLARNIAAVSTEGDIVRFTNLLGVTTEVEGTIDTINLVDNYIYINAKRS